MDMVCFTTHFRRRICQYNYPGFRSFAGLQQGKCLYPWATAFAQSFSYCTKTITISTLTRNAVTPFGSMSGTAQPAVSTPGASQSPAIMVRHGADQQWKQAPVQSASAESLLQKSKTPCFLEAWKCGLEHKTGILLSPHLFFPHLYSVTCIDYSSSETAKSYPRGSLTAPTHKWGKGAGYFQKWEAEPPINILFTSNISKTIEIAKTSSGSVHRCAVHTIPVDFSELVTSEHYGSAYQNLKQESF